MSAVGIHISTPQELLDGLSREVPPRKRSRFIEQAIARSLRERRELRLAVEYQGAAAEIRQINKELGGHG